MIPNPLHPAIVHVPIALMFLVPVAAAAVLRAIHAEHGRGRASPDVDVKDASCRSHGAFTDVAVGCTCTGVTARPPDPVRARWSGAFCGFRERAGCRKGVGTGRIAWRAFCGSIGPAMKTMRRRIAGS
jgi:hypothetical protein